MNVRKRSNKTVNILRPVDHRVLPLRINTETEHGLITEEIDGVKTIVWKHGPGWNRPDGGTMFLAIEGNPITVYLNEAKEKIFTKVPEFLQLVLGDKYNRLPPEIRDPIENNNYAASVTVTPVKMESGVDKMLDKVKAGEILKEANLRQLKDFGVSEPESNKTEEWLMRLLFGGFCAFLMYFLIKQGIV